MSSKMLCKLASIVIWLAVAGVCAETPRTKQAICSICSCNVKTKSILCNNLNLPRLFSDADWKDLNATENKVAVESISFENNGIEIITKFPSLPIRHLNFCHNSIRKIAEAAFINLDLLESLDLKYNNLTFHELKPSVFIGRFATDVYEPLRSLKYLDLSHNQLHTLDADLFEHLPNLEKLSLAWNPLIVIDTNTEIAISSIPKLSSLDLSYAELKKLPENIFHGPRMLKVLNLDGNLFESVPIQLEHAVNLVKLDFSDNVLVKIGDSESHFPVLPKLETLNFDLMPTLRYVGAGAFGNLVALRHFSCSNNHHLSEIHKQAFIQPDKLNQSRLVWPPITSLILFRNNLSTIHNELIGRWDELEDVDIRYNPWTCDCTNQWMIDTLISVMKDKASVVVDGIKCAQPDEMLGRSFLDIHSKGVQMRCLDYYGRHPEHDAAILIGIFIGVLIGIPLSMAIVIIYRRGCFGLFGYNPYPNDFTRAYYKQTTAQDKAEIWNST